MNPPWFEDSDSEDDDWMSESIRKYTHYFKYNMDQMPLKVQFHPNGKLMLVLNETSSRKYEILVYKIPAKLLAVSPKEEGLINSRELSLICGFYSQEAILDCDFHHQNLIVFAKTLGFCKVLKRKDDTSDLLIESIKFPLLPSLNLTSIRLAAFKYGIEDLKKFEFHQEELMNVLDFMAYDETKVIIIAKANKILFKNQDRQKEIPYNKQMTCVKMKRTGPRINLVSQDNENQLYTATYESEEKLEWAKLELNFSNLPALSQFLWIGDSKLALRHEKKIQVFDLLSKDSVFAQEASKKSTQMSDFDVHPTLPNVLCCCDNGKSLFLFQFQSNQKPQCAGNQV